MHICIYVCIYVCTYVCSCIFAIKSSPNWASLRKLNFPFTNYTIGAMRSSPFVFVYRKMERIIQALIEIEQFKFWSNVQICMYVYLYLYLYLWLYLYLCLYLCLYLYLYFYTYTYNINSIIIMIFINEINRDKNTLQT